MGMLVNQAQATSANDDAPNGDVYIIDAVPLSLKEIAHATRAAAPTRRRRRRHYDARPLHARHRAQGRLHCRYVHPSAPANEAPAAVAKDFCAKKWTALCPAPVLRSRTRRSSPFTRGRRQSSRAARPAARGPTGATRARCASRRGCRPKLIESRRLGRAGKPRRRSRSWPGTRGLGLRGCGLGFGV